MDTELDSSYILLESKEQDLPTPTVEKVEPLGEHPFPGKDVHRVYPASDEKIPKEIPRQCEDSHQKNLSLEKTLCEQENSEKHRRVDTDNQIEASVVSTAPEPDKSKNGADHSTVFNTTDNASPNRNKMKRKYAEQDKFINILTPKKEKSTIFLTPVKRTRRSVINGLKTGNIKLFDNSVEVRDNNTPYTSLVECFKRLEKAERTERRDSIDRIVRKYSNENK
ncbi:hypothetical protein NEQG_00377 [Nematocida parisii ERTm3]|uniref:Uncharacterized protein n=1 Tax=Nematocida parisii (strain ERTm3) TaxID=935791 RepID=I3EK60_NEMP3|nr:hypothetical protein NEQG_00377 [Nematocida parisii ERTm3]